MKKFLAVLICVLTVVACAVPMTGCSLFAPKPETELSVAEENLKAEGYEVYTNELQTTDDIIDNAGVQKSLSAKKYEDGEIVSSLVIRIYSRKSVAKAVYKQFKLELDVSKDFLKAEISYIEAMLEEYEYDLSSEEKTEFNEELAELKEELETYNDIVYGRSGDTIWYGHKSAIEASKGE